MTSTRSVGRVVGLLLLVQLIAGLILPYVLLLPLLGPAGGFLDGAAEMAGTVRLSVLMLFVGGVASLAIALAAWPAVREGHHQLGMWLLVLAAVNFTLQLLENANWLAMLSMSQAYAAADGAE